MKASLPKNDSALKKAARSYTERPLFTTPSSPFFLFFFSGLSEQLQQVASLLCSSLSTLSVKEANWLWN